MNSCITWIKSAAWLNKMFVFNHKQKQTGGNNFRPWIKSVPANTTCFVVSSAGVSPPRSAGTNWVDAMFLCNQLRHQSVTIKEARGTVGASNRVLPVNGGAWEGARDGQGGVGRHSWQSRGREEGGWRWDRINRRIKEPGRGEEERKQEKERKTLQ